MMQKLFSATVQLFQILQTVHCCLTQAHAHVEHVLNVLKKWRTGADADYKVLFQRCQAIADRMEKHMHMPRAARKQTSESSNSEEYYRKAGFVPFLDHVVMQLNKRFKKHNTLLFSIQILIPRCCPGSHASELQGCVNVYKTLLPESNTCGTEFELWTSKWKNGKTSMKPCDHRQQSLGLLSAAKFLP